ncbi:MAG: DUF4136 domain-containing protein [Acidobacteria bacterium]|nr:DUF4136 domain-containing protein [Acidobacteriota bacterium]
MKKLVGIAALVALLAVPVLAREVGSRQNPAIDLSSARTFAWKAMPEMPEGHPLAAGVALDRKIRQAVEQELTDRGLRLVAEGDPDVWVIYYVNVDNRLQIAEMDYHFGDWLDFQTELEDQHRQVRQYEKGTLVVDLIDAGSNQLAWSGWVTSAAPSLGELRRKAERKIPRSIRKMFRDFAGG